MTRKKKRTLSEVGRTLTAEDLLDGTRGRELGRTLTAEDLTRSLLDRKAARERCDAEIAALLRDLRA